MHTCTYVSMCIRSICGFLFPLKSLHDYISKYPSIHPSIQYATVHHSLKSDELVEKKKAGEVTHSEQHKKEKQNKGKREERKRKR